VAPGSRETGCCDAASEAAERAVEASYALATVCRILDAPPSTIYHRGPKVASGVDQDPRTDISDEQFLFAIPPGARELPVLQ
jgi:hypothetical protein